uniref:J domain-containing protein n=1 Tax=Chromera velia CCMP2878 TaxID=1169474 RepID=A0A0G4HNY3_9ALVE|eukprot:Cvel_7739.t1-p1 / transcript=Cvel_7739.t1 / gene=Cvel_7739 / organism=Chromera_velia_CCMP2878 / gene_product=Chaperone protein DnaJ 2, putative / transcript_product=Chaperone protein DnaJ 2, putative / location=Cvel_scaffold411:87507-90282(+) / protein_length=311 / sequence_SO=supercontig / SO=protein_coding / is_pseudo=false
MRPEAADDFDYYDVLGVPRDASDEEIKAKYREMSRLFHPDKSSLSSAFVKLNRAYKVLTNPVLRKYYDAHGPSNMKLVEDAHLEMEAEREEEELLTKQKEEGGAPWGFSSFFASAQKPAAAMREGEKLNGEGMQQPSSSSSYHHHHRSSSPPPPPPRVGRFGSSSSLFGDPLSGPPTNGNRELVKVDERLAALERRVRMALRTHEEIQATRLLGVSGQLTLSPVISAFSPSARMIGRMWGQLAYSSMTQQVRLNVDTRNQLLFSCASHVQSNSAGTSRISAAWSHTQSKGLMWRLAAVSNGMSPVSQAEGE